MNIAEWQKRLEDNFIINGVVGGNLLEIYDFEKKCGDYFINTFHGQDILLIHFKVFLRKPLILGLIGLRNMVGLKIVHITPLFLCII